MAQAVFDKQDQYGKIESGLLQGEQIIAVYDAIGAGTGFVGVTSKRVVLQDNSFVGKKVALTSVPYGSVTAVSFVSNTKCSERSQVAAKAPCRSVATPTRCSSAGTERPSMSATSSCGTCCSRRR